MRHEQVRRDAVAVVLGTLAKSLPLKHTVPIFQ